MHKIPHRNLYFMRIENYDKMSYNKGIKNKKELITMIKEKELREFMPVIKFPHAESLDFQTVANQIQRGANERGLPVAFYLDEVKYGTFGNNTEPCFVLYHPEHKDDYFKFCFRLKKQGNYAL